MQTDDGMSTATKNQVTAKIFVGCPLTSEIKLHLKQSEMWKQASIDRTALTITNFQSREYVGLFLSENKIILSELRRIEIELKQALHSYCPEIPLDTFTVITFPQVFIT